MKISFLKEGLTDERRRKHHRPAISSPKQHTAQRPHQKRRIRYGNPQNGHIGIYEAPEPWGPWKTALCANAWNIGKNGCLQHGYKSVFWNFSNKWLSEDGRDFVLAYTGPSHDQWGTVTGRFILHSD